VRRNRVVLPHMSAMGHFQTYSDLARNVRFRGRSGRKSWLSLMSGNSQKPSLGISGGYGGLLWARAALQLR